VEGGLRREIGLLGATFLAFNGVVGAGIFALPGTLHVQFGTFSPWLFPLFGLAVLLIMLPLARLASLHSETGGPVAYAAPFGRLVAFQTGWLYCLARVSAMAANATVFATYAATFWAPAGGSWGRAGMILFLVGALTLINMIGLRRALRTLDVLTLAKALPLIALAIWGLAAADGLPAPGPLPALSALEGSALLVLYAFVGFENALVPAGETDDPRRNIPRALIATLLTTASIYFLVQLAYVAVMPADAAPAAALAGLAETLMGPVGAMLVAAIVLVSVAGNVGSTLTSTPRVTFALAHQGSLPRWFGAVNERWATPANSVLFMGLVVAALALSGSFVWLAILSALARLVAYMVSIAALPKTVRPGPGLLAMVAAGLLVCLWAAAQSSWEAWAALGGALAVGLLLYAVARRQAGSSSAATV
jgi:basic amino acid/polyamine antiporter, APA family